MNRFLQHVPAFVELDVSPAAIPFETLEELLAIDFVRGWTEPFDDKPFSHFALSEHRLMAIYADGFHWWVVGFIAEPERLALPKWDGGKYAARLPDGREVTLTRDDVSSSCGSELTLRDGTTAINLGHLRDEADSAARAMAWRTH